MFVCVMFANHPTIDALHANSFCKYLKLSVLILLIRLCLQCITGTVRLAPVWSKSRWLCPFPVYQHAITFEKSLPRQICCEKSSCQIFCEKSTRHSNGQTTWFKEVTWFNAGPMLIAVFITEMVILHKYVYLLLLLLLTLPWCASILNCHPILSHHLEISLCCAVFLFVVLISLMGPNVLRECAQRLVETADFIRNKLNCQMN